MTARGPGSEAGQLMGDLAVLRAALEAGAIQRAYGALQAFMRRLRLHMAASGALGSVSALSVGTLDVTYFAVFPPALAARSLKVPVVLNYDAFRFEVWLSGRTRAVQRRYGAVLGASSWPGCRVRRPGPGVDALLERDVAAVDLRDAAGLVATIEAGVGTFVGEVERYLAAHGPPVG